MVWSGSLARMGAAPADDGSVSQGYLETLTSLSCPWKANHSDHDYSGPGEGSEGGSPASWSS